MWVITATLAQFLPLLRRLLEVLVTITILGPFGNAVYDVAQDRPTLSVQEYFIRTWEWTLIPTVLVGAVIWMASRAEDVLSRRGTFLVLKTARKIAPADLGFVEAEAVDSSPSAARPYYPYYVARRAGAYSFLSQHAVGRKWTEEQLKTGLVNGQSLIFHGPPMDGKSRIICSLVRELDGWLVCIPHKDRPAPSRDSYSLIKSRNVILVLDDIFTFSQIDVLHLYREITRQAKKVVIVASCREGDELKVMQEGTLGLARFYEEIPRKVQLLPPTVNELKELAFHIGADWDPQLKDSRMPIGAVAMHGFLEITRSRMASLNQDMSEFLDAVICLSWIGCPATHARVTVVFQSLCNRPLSDIYRYLHTLAEGGFIHAPFSQDPILVRAEYILAPMAETEDADRYEAALPQLGSALEASVDLKAMQAVAWKLSTISQHSLAERLLLKASQLAILQSPPQPGVILSKGVYYGLQKKNSQAIVAFDQVIRLGADDELLWLAWYNKGTSRMYQNQYKMAVNDFTKSLSYKPDDPNSLYNIGICFLRLTKYEEAATIFDRVLQFKEDADTWVNLGVAFVNMKRPDDEVLRCFRKAVSIDPTHPLALSNEGRVLFNMKRYSEARKSLDAALLADPEDGKSWLMLSKCLARLREFTKAARTCDRAIDLLPEDPEVWSWFAHIAPNENGVDRALAAIENMKKDLGTHPVYWLSKAHILAHAPSRYHKDGGKEATLTVCSAWQQRKHLSEPNRDVLVHSMELLGVSAEQCRPAAMRSSSGKRRQRSRR